MRRDPSKSIPTRASESQSWIQWHKDLKRLFGKRQATTIWLQGWEKRGGVDSKANTVALRNYMEKQGVVLDKNALASFADFGDDVGDFFGSMFGTFKWVGIGLSVILVVGVGMVVFNIARRPQNFKAPKR